MSFGRSVLVGVMVCVLVAPGALGAGPGATMSAARPQTLRTLVFQQGADGYLGVRDTWVSSMGWDTPVQYSVNYGQNSVLRLSHNAGDNPLLRFDLSAIPANSAVFSATLALYNVTPAQGFTRRMTLHRVLRAWDEGSEVQSPINAAGKHGATGDYAAQYYPGQGANAPWGGRGMAEGADYAASPEGYADVGDAGWYTWDVTALVRQWVRGEQPNEGLTLRDATGYQDGNLDWRDMHSSQATSDASLRPKLTVLYDPNVPYANAGPDQSALQWTGSSLTLDGSASHDRPGGNNATLRYAWRVAQAAYGSALAGASLGSARSVAWLPDVAGEWDIELTVTNDVGASATDRVHLRVLSIPATHPRIHLTAAKLAALRARATGGNPRWAQLLGEANATDGEMLAKALVYQVTGQAHYADEAIAAAFSVMGGAQDSSTAGDVALVYDWCYARLSANQRAAMHTFFGTWADAPHGNDVSGLGNYWPRYGRSYALMGLATYGDNARAGEWLDEFRYRRYRDIDLAQFEHIADGGGWPEGTVYDWIANLPRMEGVAAWLTATGEDLFASTTWYQGRLGYLLLQHDPGAASQWGSPYHPYPSTGDAERNRGSMANYGRIMALILIERYPADPLARQLQAYLTTPPVNNSMSFLYHDEFLWFNPDQPADVPALLTHYAAGTGTLLMRSGWPSGAADSDAGATSLIFQAGDRFSYHQHYDQNSFTLFKGGDLAVDSGVYSGNGLSYHDVNYYVRTIAHNTLVVYNPSEDFQHARPDASSNDGGQRTMSPASRHPPSEDYWQQYAVQYDTADMRRMEDAARYTYALGDATQAYNNPVYNQALDTGLSGNIAKVSRFQREFLYLRPEGAGGAEFAVLYDRVGVTQPAFSGANTKLLLHVLNEPTVNGTPTSVSPGETLYRGADLATATAGSGKLFMKTLLPANRQLRKVGGRGVKAFWVFGANYDWHWGADESQPRPSNDFEDLPYGEWRLELEPGDTGLEHGFLTILQPVSSTVTAMAPTTLISGTGLAGVHIAAPDLNRVALFSAANDGRAPAGTLAFGYTPTARSLVFVADLLPGARYRLTTALQGAAQSVSLAPDGAGALQVSSQGVLSFLVEVAPFRAIMPWIANYGSAAGGWSSQEAFPRTVADVNGDGKADVVGFGYAGAYVSLSSGLGLAPMTRWSSGLGSGAAAGGWASQTVYPRLLADVNGDGKADVVGFGAAGVYVALATPTGAAWGTAFGPLARWGAGLGLLPAAGGWTSQDLYPRALGDVNGDGKADAVGFGAAGVYVALSSGSAFGPLSRWSPSFGCLPAAGGWSNQNTFPRALGDVNGDGQADIVGFGAAGAYVALSGGSAFGPMSATPWIRAYGASPAGGGWSSQELYPRVLADVNADGKADIVGFGGAGVYYALSGGAGFGPMTLGSGSLGASPAAGGWSSQNATPRCAADMSGDRQADLVGFGANGVVVGLRN